MSTGNDSILDAYLFETNGLLEQLDSIMPEAEIMDIDVIDPYGCLFFNVCD